MENKRAAILLSVRLGFALKEEYLHDEELKEAIELAVNCLLEKEKEND